MIVYNSYESREGIVMYQAIARSEDIPEGSGKVVQASHVFNRSRFNPHRE
jgi:hypothetical protein